ncbi:helix-turn-helix domain-containing protein [Clostridium oryzae]|uniref:Helix-turn-helix domain protein n=1 Tax=Clostridium oryzae TaxID=1450648 RepID=A0A1V4IXN1_9CLOT|nr:helix-turn-helix transcriptional regulator [Clostridium oryzae]OPJ64157.1 helix-turn-helix domain protein [Clostridium oryzae]
MEHYIGIKIKQLRKEKNLPQKSLCCDILDRTVLSKIENCKMLPSIPQLQYIAQKLNTDISFFLDNSLAHNPNCTNHMTNEFEYIHSLFINNQFLDIIELWENRRLKHINMDYFCYYLGISYFRLNLINQSVQFLKKFLNFYFKLSNYEKDINVEKYANSINILATIEVSNKNFKKAVNYLLRSKLYLENYNRTNIESYIKTISNIGTIYCINQNYAGCIEILEEYLLNNKVSTPIEALPNIHLSLNVAYCRLGHYDKAINHIKNAIFLFSYCDKNFDSLECYLNYTNCLRFQKKYDQSFKILDSISSEVNYDKRLSDIFSVQKMLLFFNMKKYDTVIKISSKIKESALRTSSKNEYYFMLGYIAFTKENFNAAKRYLLKCEKYLLDKKLYADLVLLYNDLFYITKDKKYKIQSTKYSKEKCYYQIYIP